MPSSHAWIFQATPTMADLAAELRTGEALSWTVGRYGRALRPGDRVYYWQAGRDAGIYGLGRVHAAPIRAADGRYTVRTTHERAFFAPLTRAELRADPELRDLAVLRQPRGTIFPVTPAQDVALARRSGQSAMVLAVAASRRAARQVRLRRATDGDLPARVEEAHAHGDEVEVLVVAGGDITERTRVEGVRRRRDGDLELRLVPLPGAAPSSVSPDLAAQLEAGQAVQLQAEPAPLSAQTPAPPLRRTAERAGPYETAPPFAPAPDEITGDLELPSSLVAELVATINAGRHIVLVGAPGTGKTSLALNLARAAARAGLCAGPLLTTATADWTTFDVVGGLVPAHDGALRFAEGVALRALRENRWLVLDELNRADIDKAFGPLLTVLSGGPVDLPTVTVDGRPIRIEPVAAGSGLAADGVTYRAGPGWRIIATMNTLDRAALFSFSLAFARRFAFVLVPVPDPAALLALVQRRVPLEGAAVAMLERLLQVTPRPLGPAIVLDAARYIAVRADAAALVEALGAVVLPQFEGLDHATLIAFVHDLAPALGPGDEDTLLAYVRALFGEG